MFNIILASNSKIRKKILDKNNINSIVEPSNVDEELIKNSLLKDSVAPFLQNETTLGFDDDRIPNTGIFIKDSVITKIGLAKSGQKPYISLILGNFPNVNIWSPPGYPFVCIEPMASHHDFEDSPKIFKINFDHTRLQ